MDHPAGPSHKYVEAGFVDGRACAATSYRYMISICYCLLFGIDYQGSLGARLGKFKDLIRYHGWAEAGHTEHPLLLFYSDISLMPL